MVPGISLNFLLPVLWDIYPHIHIMLWRQKVKKKAKEMEAFDQLMFIGKRISVFNYRNKFLSDFTSSFVEGLSR